MARATLTCKTCGKEYPACSTANWGVWRWQDVACCKEHAMEYIALVEQSRNKAKVTTQETAQEKPAKPQKRLTARLIAKQDSPENWTEQEPFVKDEHVEEAE